MYIYLGVPSSVDSLRVSTRNYEVHVTWSAAFSLDIPDVDPDLTYCIQISNASNTAHSICNITALSYNYTLPDGRSICNNYSVRVFAVNVVGRSFYKEKLIMANGMR